jgi:hypothetical protein
MLRVMVRLGLGALAALNLWWGAWARLVPRQFYDSFPGFGHHWTAAYPPYNEHLIEDLGATFLTLGLLLALATALADRRVRLTVLGAVLAFNLLHLQFHAGHQGTMSTMDYGASIGALALGVLAPVLLAGLDALAARRPPRTPPAPD